MRQEKERQNDVYCLSDRFRAATQLSKEDLKSFFSLEKQNVLPSKFRTERYDEEQYLCKLYEQELDEETDKDLHDVLNLNLLEFKLSIDNDLQLKDGEDDQAFSTFFVNPMYRLHLKEAAEKCRSNEKYKQMLFDKIDLLITALRSDRELFRKRRDTGKRVRA